MSFDTTVLFESPPISEAEHLVKVRDCLGTRLQPAVVEEVSEAAAQVDPVAALRRSQALQDPSAEAISMLAVARVVVGKE